MDKHRDERLDFIKRSVNGGRPANLVIVLDTDSDTFSGQLQAMGGLTGVPTTFSLPDLVTSYVGDAVLQRMANASTIARSYNVVPQISPGVVPRADITPKVRGGWRVMLMVSSGSSVKNTRHWEYIQHLFRG
jgi:hypothetical protein